MGKLLLLPCFLLCIPQVTRMIINDEPYFLLRELEPSTAYTVKMRAKLHGSEGLWSEWSEEFTWKTDSGTFHFVFPPVQDCKGVAGKAI